MTREEKIGRLAAFLDEWRIGQELDKVRDIPSSQTGADTPEKPFPASRISGGVPNPGDIWLLPPLTPVTRRRPVYVALVARRGADGWLCAPFSRFSSPATDGELVSRKPADALAVIQVWNAGVVPEDILADGWMVGRLGADDLKAVASYVEQGKPLPDARRGAPVAHPLDPRLDYIEEERELWFGLRNETLADIPEIAELEAAESDTEQGRGGGGGGRR